MSLPNDERPTVQADPDLLQSLKPLDIEIMKRLGTRVHLIPVIAKADTLTQNDLFVFKQRIREVITAQGIRIYQPPVETDDEAAAEHARMLADAMPFSIIGSTEDVQTPDGRVVKGREYLWGVAEVENENHCDFRKLRSLLIRTHMLDLISTTEELHYENYRQQQMETRKFGEPKVKKVDNPKFKEEEEQLRKRFTEQVKAEEARFRQWEQHVCGSFWAMKPANVIVHSSSRSEIVSTRTWRWHTAPSSSSRQSSTTFKPDMVVEVPDDEHPEACCILPSRNFFSILAKATAYTLPCSRSFVFQL